jgi:hypothetical protein
MEEVREVSIVESASRTPSRLASLTRRFGKSLSVNRRGSSLTSVDEAGGDQAKAAR